MRKFLALIVLVVFLFNTVGYYFAYQTIRSRSNTLLSARFDTDQYQAEEVVTTKLPLAIPYQSTTEYQRAHAAFEHQGEFYRLVKQKIENDNLYVVCYRDHTEKKLSSLLSDFVKVTHDLPASSKPGALKL